MGVFYDIAPCSLLGVDRRFRYAYCHHHHVSLMMEAVRTPWNVGLLEGDYTALYPRRLLRTRCLKNLKFHSYAHNFSQNMWNEDLGVDCRIIFLFIQTGCEDTDWFHLSQNRILRRALVNAWWDSELKRGVGIPRAEHVARYDYLPKKNCPYS
jgi:hypothetical protein